MFRCVICLLMSFRILVCCSGKCCMVGCRFMLVWVWGCCCWFLLLVILSRVFIVFVVLICVCLLWFRFLFVMVWLVCVWFVIICGVMCLRCWVLLMWFLMVFSGLGFILVFVSI